MQMKGSCYLIRLSKDPEDREVVNIGVGLLTSCGKFISKIKHSSDVDGTEKFDLAFRFAKDITKQLSTLSRKHGVTETERKLSELENSLQNTIRIRLVDKCVLQDPNAYLEDQYNSLVK